MAARLLPSYVKVTFSSTMSFSREDIGFSVWSAAGERMKVMPVNHV
jgi:hypothetical protein